MSSDELLKSPEWEGEEKTLQIISEYIRELTGFEGEVTLDDLLIEEIGLDSLDFLELFFKIQTYIRSDLTNQQLNILLHAEITSESSKNSEIEGVSLYSRLRVCHLVGLVRRQLARPLNIEGFDYHSWREIFFPSEQSAKPANQGWQSLIDYMVTNETQFKSRISDLNQLSEETLEHLWLQDDAGFTVIENYLRINESESKSLSELESKLRKMLETHHLVDELRNRLARDCILRALDIQNTQQDDADQWYWIIHDYVDKELQNDNFMELSESNLFSIDLQDFQRQNLRDLIRVKMVDFIRLKIDQILNSTNQQQELLEQFIQEEYSVNEPALFSAGNLQHSQTRLIHWYVRNNRAFLMREFRETYFESLLNELNVVPELEPFSNNQKCFMDQLSKVKRVRKVQSFEEKYILFSRQGYLEIDALKKRWDEKTDEYEKTVFSLSNEWNTSFQYLRSFPRTGVTKERILILMIPNENWIEIIDNLVTKNRQDLHIAFLHTSLDFQRISQSIFRELFIQIVLDWKQIIDCLDDSHISGTIDKIEKDWQEFEIKLGSEDYKALDIFLSVGIEVFSEWQQDEIFEFLVNPSEEILLELTNSQVIQQLVSN